MIVLVVVLVFTVAICVAGWVPYVRDALRVDHVLPGPALPEAPAPVAPATRPESGPELLPETLSA